MGRGRHRVREKVRDGGREGERARGGGLRSQRGRGDRGGGGADRGDVPIRLFPFRLMSKRGTFSVEKKRVLNGVKSSYQIALYHGFVNFLLLHCFVNYFLDACALAVKLG